MKYFSRLVVVVVELKSTGYHLALVFTASLSEVENGLKPCRICKADLLHRVLQGLRWKLDACAL